MPPTDNFWIREVTLEPRSDCTDITTLFSEAAKLASNGTKVTFEKSGLRVTV